MYINQSNWHLWFFTTFFLSGAYRAIWFLILIKIYISKKVYIQSFIFHLNVFFFHFQLKLIFTITLVIFIKLNKFQMFLTYGYEKLHKYNPIYIAVVSFFLACLYNMYDSFSFITRNIMLKLGVLNGWICYYNIYLDMMSHVEITELTSNVYSNVTFRIPSSQLCKQQELHIFIFTDINNIM